MKNKDIDIIKNMKTVEWLKAQLLNTVANLYSTLADAEESTKENLEDIISNLILESLLLGKRLGLDYKNIESALRDNIKLNLIEEHKIEKWYGDLSILLEFIDKHKD
ncbi:MazG-like family protein [Tissierella praeacuta DSM 18095]|uniref:MazG-like family protein n=1 Tax=Tissierella praeacuta DSM 18095 TaxID=1123404 RepID=A0A1M4Y3A3_9FIRM|nr:MazG-like family protein [Tissierella praeacuta]SHF00307.1 MazG-like family protein [Tissierella praeacuta DSM 18095]SUO98874.1 MazG-like family [Tissierella praeacuta]